MTYKEAMMTAAIELGQKEDVIAKAVKWADELVPNAGSQMNVTIPRGAERAVIDRFKTKLNRTPEEILESLTKNWPLHQRKISDN